MSTTERLKDLKSSLVTAWDNADKLPLTERFGYLAASPVLGVVAYYMGADVTPYLFDKIQIRDLDILGLKFLIPTIGTAISGAITLAAGGWAASTGIDGILGRKILTQKTGAPSLE